MARPRKDLETRFWEKVNLNGPMTNPDIGYCWIWTGALHSGYGRISLGSPSTEFMDYQAHIASWIIHYGPVPDGLCVLHKCDLRKCIRPDHLWLGTKGDNNRDCVAKGRQPGNLGKGKVLTPEKVREIRALSNATSRKALALRFGVAEGSIQKVLNGSTWSWVNAAPGQSQPGAA